MKRSIRGYSTTDINRLIGLCSGIEFKTIFYKYYKIRLAYNYFQSIIGGNGNTVFSTDSIKGKPK